MLFKNDNLPDTEAYKRNPAILHREDWASHEHSWKGYFQGKDIGTGVTVLFYVTDNVGEGHFGMCILTMRFSSFARETLYSR